MASNIYRGIQLIIDVIDYKMLKRKISGIYSSRSCLLPRIFTQPLFEFISLLLCGWSLLFKVETYCSRTGAYCYGVKTYYNQQ